MLDQSLQALSINKVQENCGTLGHVHYCGCQKRVSQVTTMRQVRAKSYYWVPTSVSIKNK